MNLKRKLWQCTANIKLKKKCDCIYSNICYDGKEHNGKLQKSKWNAKIQIIGPKEHI
jgi:hypothetical protein